MEEEKNLSSFLEILGIYPLPKSKEAYCWEGSEEETGHDYWDRVERYEFPPSVNEEKISLNRVERYEFPPSVKEEKISLGMVERYEFPPSVDEEKN